MVSIGVNFIGCSVFTGQMGLTGLVISVALSSMTGFVLLFIFVPVQAKIDKTGLLLSACRSLFLSAIMFCLVEYASRLLFREAAGKFELGAALTGSIVLGILIYIGLNVLISNPDFMLVKQTMIEKFNDKK